MRLMIAFGCAVLLVLSFTARAAEQARPCGAPEYHQFDFWVGDWEVRTPDGAVAGTNRITSLLDGCGLQENWRGASGSRGTSLNAYDSARRVWHQTWIDGAGSILLLEGSLMNGKMTLSGTTRTPGGDTQVERITWEPLTGGDVRQLWEQSSDGGRNWAVAFDGRYTRARRRART